MDSQVGYEMACIAATVRDGHPLELMLVDKVLKEGQYPPWQGAAIRLLSLHFQNSSNEVTLQKADSLSTVAKVLQTTAPITTAKVPLKHLLNLQFQQFEEYCQSQNQPYLNQLRSHSHGLYPPNAPKDTNSIFSKHYHLKQSFQGNPHWMLARYALSQWFTVNKEDLPKNVQEIYHFLLSKDEFIDKEQGFKALWALLYAYYTQQALEMRVDSQYSQPHFLTWKRSQKEYYRKQFQSFQGSLLGVQKLVFLLMAGLLSQFQLEAGASQKHLTSAFNLFAYQLGRVTDWQMLVITLFMKVAEQREDQSLVLHVQGLIKQKFQRSELQCSHCFISIFFSFEELLPFMLAKKIDSQQLLLSESRKIQLAEYLLTNNKLPQDMLRYLNTSHFRQVFGGKSWQSTDYVDCMLPIMDSNRGVFIKQLAWVSGCSDQRIVTEEFDLFYEVWNSVFEIDRSESPSFQLLTKATLIKRSDFRPAFHFLVNPKDFTAIVLKILMGYFRYFDGCKDNMKAGGPQLLCFRKFQEEELKNLMIDLNQSERNTFWQQWGQLLRHDPQFVQDLLQPQQAIFPE